MKRYVDQKLDMQFEMISQQNKILQKQNKPYNYNNPIIRNKSLGTNIQNIFSESGTSIIFYLYQKVQQNTNINPKITN